MVIAVMPGHGSDIAEMAPIRRLVDREIVEERQRQAGMTPCGT